MILPVILSGGAGSRLWPLSTPAHPKQLLPLVGERTMIQETAARFEGADFLSPAVICNAAHADAVAAQVAGDGVIGLEQVGRNTAAAAAWAALIGRDAGAELVLLAPADHHITDVGAFREAVAEAAGVARSGHIVTFGIQPTRPETGYGYIRMSETLQGGVRRVEAFVEKPDTATAQRYVATGDYAWNAGLFLFRPDTLLSEMKQHAADILESLEIALADGRREGRYVHPHAERFAATRSQSFDYAVMETTDLAACLPVEMGWTDIGSFEALLTARKRDAQGNALPRLSRALDAKNCLVDTDGPRVSLVGVENLGVIVRDGEVLVIDLAQSQRVKHLDS